MCCLAEARFICLKCLYISLEADCNWYQASLRQLYSLRGMTWHSHYFYKMLHKFGEDFAASIKNIVQNDTTPLQKNTKQLAPSMNEGHLELFLTALTSFYRCSVWLRSILHLLNRFPVGLTPASWKPCFRKPLVFGGHFDHRFCNFGAS